MKLKITKKTINHFLEYNWYIILGCLILSYATFYVSLHSIHAYKDHEKVNFFIEGQYIKDEEVKDDLINNIDGLYEINYHIAPSQSESLYRLYEGYFDTSDIYILRKQDFIDMQHLIKDKFINITNTFLSQITNNNFLEFYTYENNNYAIKIYDADDKNYNNLLGFENFMEFDQNGDDYYLSFNNESLKFNLTPDSNSIALEAISYLFRRYSHE